MALKHLDTEPALDLLEFTYQDLLGLERAGVLGDKRVELLRGQLVVMTVNPPHAAAVAHLNRRMNAAFSERAQIVVQSPLRLSAALNDTDLPEPDVMLVADPEKVYPDHPHPEDVFLLIEVSDSTLLKDRTLKLALYARHQIREYWIVNLKDKRLEVYTQPEGDEYLNRQSYGLFDMVAPRAFAEVRRAWLPETLSELLT